ncbi:U-Kazal-Dg21.2-like [Anastrepha ludens]|uniref:U-Kazal-Dg21.2-like n=1 Tax=Anastrepha ludens TaxID=28586 RepID=UPI0023B0F99E|nr:U-Kazal-Dg21.2-like [Anastrepha ludens]
MCKITSKQLLAIFGLTLFSAYFVSVSKATPQCAYKCSNDEDVVWSTDEDGLECEVFRNGCHLLSENCQRENSKKLHEISKEECQKKCRTVCTLESEPLCGEYNGNQRNFSNNCDMKNYICRTGETYVSYTLGACK